MLKKILKRNDSVADKLILERLETCGIENAYKKYYNAKLKMWIYILSAGITFIQLLKSLFDSTTAMITVNAFLALILISILEARDTREGMKEFKKDFELIKTSLFRDRADLGSIIFEDQVEGR